MKKTFPITLLLTMLVGGFVFVGIIPVSIAENSTTVDGVIYSDTIWTKADSPFVLTGLVGIASGVTLTIEPGATVNLGEYSLQVAGTLYARGGRSENNITFISKTAAYGNIAFTNGSASWDEKTGSGSIIENAILRSTSISVHNVSPKIYNNTVTGNINVDYEGTPLISNNLIVGDVGVHSSSPIIDHNSIIGGINIGGDAPAISNNIIEGGGVAGVGIKFEGRYSINITSNVVYNCSIGISARGSATIAKNLLINNDRGLEVSSSQITIQNNTIAKNVVGIKLLDVWTNAPMTITSNNIQNNAQSSIYLEDARSDVDASLNWWGTVEAQLINMTIHDRKNEPKLGIVTFVPTLSAPVPEAPNTEFTPISRSPLPSQEPSATTLDQTETRLSTQIGILELAVAAIILSVAINVSLVIVVAKLLRKKN